MRKLWKLYSYAKAPLKTFAVLHPVKMVKYGAYFFVGKTLFLWGKKVGRQEVIGEGEEALPAEGSEAIESARAAPEDA